MSKKAPTRWKMPLTWEKGYHNEEKDTKKDPYRRKVAKSPPPPHIDNKFSHFPGGETAVYSYLPTSPPPCRRPCVYVSLYDASV